MSAFVVSWICLCLLLDHDPYCHVFFVKIRIHSRYHRRRGAQDAESRLMLRTFGTVGAFYEVIEIRNSLFLPDHRVGALLINKMSEIHCEQRTSCGRNYDWA